MREYDIQILASHDGAFERVMESKCSDLLTSNSKPS